MANLYIKKIYEAPLVQYDKAPGTAYYPGENTLAWGIDKYHDALVAGDNEIVFGEIVKITGANEVGATIEPIVNADTAPNFAIVVKTQAGGIKFPAGKGQKIYTQLKTLPFRIWPLGTAAAPTTDQNDWITVAYSGDKEVGEAITGAVYTPKLASDTNGVNGTATDATAGNLRVSNLEFFGKVFSPVNNPALKCAKVRAGGKL